MVRPRSIPAARWSGQMMCSPQAGLARLTLQKAACYWTRVPAPVLLETDNLMRAYGSLLAVDRASVTVREGELRSGRDTAVPGSLDEGGRAGAHTPGAGRDG